jgi:hypothetical protein
MSFSEQAESPRSTDLAFERHYKIGEIAKLWSLGFHTVQRHFIDEPGVLKEVSNGTLKKRRYTTLRVPESVMKRVHRRLHS